MSGTTGVACAHAEGRVDRIGWSIPVCRCVGCGEFLSFRDSATDGREVSASMQRVVVDAALTHPYDAAIIPDYFVVGNDQGQLWVNYSNDSWWADPPMDGRGTGWALNYEDRRVAERLADEVGGFVVAVSAASHERASDGGSATIAAVGFLLGLAGAALIALWVVQRLMWTLGSPDACWGSCG